jgi:hypothetical protein
MVAFWLERSWSRQALDHPTLLSIGLDLPHEQSTPVTSDMLSSVLRIVRRKLLYERCVHLPDYYQLEKLKAVLLSFSFLGIFCIL